MPQRLLHKVNANLPLIVWVLVGALIGWSVYKAWDNSQDVGKAANQNRKLIVANSQLLEQIQISRRLSCEKNYESIREVFQIFITPGTIRTPEQQRRVDRFNHRIDTLKAGCIRQTHPSPPPKKKGG